MTPSSLSGQETLPSQPQNQKPAEPQGRTDGDDKDVVVLAPPEAVKDELVSKKTLNSSRIGNQVESRFNFDASARFARCSIKADTGDGKLLRRALDGVINSVDQNKAQRQFVQSYFVCAADGETARSAAGIVTRSGKISTVSSDVSLADAGVERQQYYDRGAMFIRAVQLFGSTDRLTRDQFNDPAVKARFIKREPPLAQLRPPTDRTYLAAAICLVRNQPELASKLVVNDMSTQNRQFLSQTLVNRSKSCFDGVRSVYFDPLQLRFYLADALYRWLVAIDGSDSLIPLSK